MQRPQRAIVIHSPHSGRSAQLSTALMYLREMDVEIVKDISIAELDPFPVQGAIWKEQRIDVAIAAGGDGVVGGVITHIAQSSLPLGILPLGTANDIARSLHIPQKLHAAAEVISQGQEQAIDIGVAQPAEEAPHQASQPQEGLVPGWVSPQKHGYFAHALTVGLNVQFARIATNVVMRQRFGRMTYPVAAIEVLRSHEPLEVELHFEGVSLPPTSQLIWRHMASIPAPVDVVPALRCRALQVTVVNAPIFGGQWQLAIPWASLTDRLLDIIVIEDTEVGDLNRRLTHFFASEEQTLSSHAQEYYPAHHPAELTGIPGLHHIQARGVTITTSIDPCDVTLDGEVRGQTPMHVQLADERLRVRVPQ